MFQSFKLWKLAGTLNSRDPQSAYSAVKEVGRAGGPKAVELLTSALARNDGVARAAARELGVMGGAAAVAPLVSALTRPELNKSAVEALVHLGAPAVGALIEALGSEDPVTRALSAEALGGIGDRRAVDRLIELVQGDNAYAVRTAAASALGKLKDARAIWVLVATLKLRDESAENRQGPLQELRDAAALAMRRIGDPLAERQARTGPPTTAEAVQRLEESLTESDVHPRLIGEVRELTERELTDVLRELIASSEEISWAKLEAREPVMVPWFGDYEKRRLAAEQVGAELHRRGGRRLLDRVLEAELGGYPAIRNWWVAFE